MKPNKLLMALATSLAFAMPITAEAIAINFSPSSQTKVVGQNASVDIVVSGLNTPNEIVSAFDLDVLFNPAIASFVSYSVDSAFFDLSLGASGGSIDIAGFSLETDEDVLAGLQGDSVILATIVFNGISVGTTALDFDTNLAFGQNVVGRNGASLTMDVGSGSLTFRDDGTQVPEPGSLALAALAIAGLAAVRRRRS